MLLDSWMAGFANPASRLVWKQIGNGVTRRASSYPDPHPATTFGETSQMNDLSRLTECTAKLRLRDHVDVAVNTVDAVKFRNFRPRNDRLDSRITCACKKPLYESQGGNAYENTPNSSPFRSSAKTKLSNPLLRRRSESGSSTALRRRALVAGRNGTAAKFVWNLRSVRARVDRGKNFFVIAPR